MAVSVGDTASLTFTVTEADTAVAVGSGDVPVLGTPRLIAWCEAATVAASADRLEEGQTSVGTRVLVDHLAPTAVGGVVEVAAVVVTVDGRQLTFDVTATDGTGPIGRGSIARVVVDRAKFLSRLG